MKSKTHKRLKVVREMLLPMVYKYPYNHHKPIPIEIINAINNHFNPILKHSEL